MPEIIPKNNYYILALFLGNFGLSLLHTVFQFYYVKVFLNIYNVNEYWFNLAQLFFCFWNAVNDPLFGYLQDICGTWMRDRSKIFTYFGPFLVLSFLLPWFPWRTGSDSPPYVEGLHLIVSLFFYDAFFSCVGVAWSALFSDSTRNHRKRVRAVKYAQLATLCSVNSITVIEKVSKSLENFGAFQIICLTLGFVSLVCMYLTGRFGYSSNAAYSVPEKLLEEDELEHSDEQSKIQHNDEWTWRGVLILTKELLTAKDFQCVVFVNFIHICRSTAHLNFAAIATDILIPQTILPKGSWQLSAFFATCTLLPQILIITNDKLILRHGAYNVMLYGLFTSICSSVLFLFSKSPYVVILFMLIDSINVHSISPLFNILLSEVIEDDKTQNHRRKSLSSLIFSLNALITKPAISIAPVIIVFLLNRNGYEQYQREQIKSIQLHSCMNHVIFAIPLFLGIIEILLFRRYSLRNKHRLSVLSI